MRIPGGAANSGLRVILLSAAVVTAACALPADASPATTIEINAAFGPYRLGMTLAEAKATSPSMKLRTDATSATAAIGGLQLTFSRPRGSAAAFTLHFMYALRGMPANRRYRTDRGIGVGSTRGELSRAYPSMKCFDQKDGGPLVRFDAREIRLSQQTPWTCMFGRLLPGHEGGRYMHNCVTTGFGFNDSKSTTVVTISMQQYPRFVRGRFDNCREFCESKGFRETRCLGQVVRSSRRAASSGERERP